MSTLEKVWPNPAQPGEIRNPKGINGWTYRREFEQAMARLASGGTGLRTAPLDLTRYQRARCGWCALPVAKDDDHPPVVVEELGPMHQACVALARGLTRSELLARVLWGKALRGEDAAIKQLLARLWPERHVVIPELPDQDQVVAPAARFEALPPDTRELVHSTLSALIQGKPELAGVVDVTPAAAELESAEPAPST